MWQHQGKSCQDDVHSSELKWSIWRISFQLKKNYSQVSAFEATFSEKQKCCAVQTTQIKVQWQNCLNWLIRDGWPYQNGWIFGKVPNGLWPPPSLLIFGKSSCNFCLKASEQSCLQVQNLQHIYLDWKWLPPLAPFQKFIRFGSGTLPLLTQWNIPNKLRNSYIDIEG